MLIAVCFHGRIVGYQQRYENVRHLFRGHEVHFYLSHDPSLNEDIRPFVSLFKPVKVIDSALEVFDFSRFQFGGVHPQTPWKTIAQFANKQRAYRLIDRPERYDLIASMRVDVIDTSDIDFSLFDHDAVYVPEGCDYPQQSKNALNDQMAFGPPKAMKSYFEAYSGIEALLSEGCFFHAETLLAYSLSTEVRRFKHSWVIVRSVDRST